MGIIGLAIAIAIAIYLIPIIIVGSFYVFLIAFAVIGGVILEICSLFRKLFKLIP